jgi:hypothetical protein
MLACNSFHTGPKTKYHLCYLRSDSDEEFAIKAKHFRRHRKTSLMSNGESDDGEDQVRRGARYLTGENLKVVGENLKVVWAEFSF